MAIKSPISVVLLVHNEAAIIESVIRGFHEQVTSKLPGSEILIAEDGSTDGTQAILTRLQSEIGELRIHTGKEKRGYVNAFKFAMTLPKNELILFCDSSGKYDPADFWNMAEAMEGHDMVLGYKIRRKDPLYRILLAKGFNLAVNQYFGVRFRDIDCPLRLFKKSAFQVISAEPWIQKHLINFELTLRMVNRGYRVREIPIAHFARSNGPSRGLPLKTIPNVILTTLRNFPAIKKDLAKCARLS